MNTEESYINMLNIVKFAVGIVPLLAGLLIGSILGAFWSGLTEAFNHFTE